MSYFAIIFSGFCGGGVRGIVGYLKYKFSYKNVPFKKNEFLGTIVLSGIVGLMTSVSLNEIGFNLNGHFGFGLAFIAGYAGGDFIENIYKIIIKKSSVYSIAKKRDDN